MTQGDGPHDGGDGAGMEAEAASVHDSGIDEGSAGAAGEILDAEVVDEDHDPDADAVGVDIADVIDADVADVMDAIELDPLTAAEAERDEYLDSLRRLQAEFENYKKRVVKQQADQGSRAVAALVDKLLPVLDALDLATDHVGDVDSEEARALIAASGLLQGVLAKEGLERIDPVGQEFDPNDHEAVGQIPALDDAETTESGEPVVAQVMRAGYRWHGTIVRPAMVMVQG